MAHTYITIVADPTQQKNIVKALNHRKYKMEGHPREGYCIPHISEVKTYEIRAKKEVIPQILADLKVGEMISERTVKSLMDNGGSRTGVKIGFKIKILKRFVQMFWWVLKKFEFHPLPFNRELKAERLVNGWHYCYGWGYRKDPESKFGEELSILTPAGIGFVLILLAQILGTII